MKELQSTIEASISAASDDATDAEDDNDMSCVDVKSKSFEKYAPVITQFKVCIIRQSSGSVDNICLSLTLNTFPVCFEYFE